MSLNQSKNNREKVYSFDKHPFTLIGLSDREKFHTGMLAFAMSSDGFGRCFAEKIFGDLPAGDLSTATEEASVDLVVKIDGKIIAFAEVKLKTDLHDNQLKKYADKINSDAKKVVIGLFPPIDTSEMDDNGYEFVGLTDKVFAALTSCLKDKSNKLDTHIFSMFELWKTYLEGLKTLKKDFCCMPKENVSTLKDECEKIKLRGIFERQILARIQKDVEKKYLEKKYLEEDRNWHSKIANTHGNTLLEFYIAFKGADRRYGIQWQGDSLKLFITDKKKRKERTEVLERVAKKVIKDCNGHNLNVLKNTGENIKANRDGVFRSVIISEWEMWGDTSTRAKDFCFILEQMENYIDDVKKIYKA